MTDTNYSDQEFPSAACIVDYLRCSVTFATPQDLLSAVNGFIDKVENHEVDCISGIVRIKNGFKNILVWEKIDDYGYVDLEMNVIFTNKSRTESQLVEIRFLLNFLLHAKKLGHKYYEIKRKDGQVNAVGNIMYNEYNNYDKYSLKIETVIQEDNPNELAKQLLLRPNCILSMLHFANNIEDTFVPYLYLVGGSYSLKMFKLFYECLLHFGEVLLDETKPKNCNVGCYSDSNNPNKYTGSDFDEKAIKYKLFIRKYLNFTLGNGEAVHNSTFVKLKRIMFENNPSIIKLIAIALFDFCFVVFFLLTVFTVGSKIG